MTTEKQKAARIRNWKIRQLRGAYKILWLTAKREAPTPAARQYASHACTLIDAILAEIGAETEKARRHRMFLEATRA